MMAPDYAHWHGMYEVAERFYMELIPQARELASHAAADGHPDKATAVNKVIDEIMAKPEHKWAPALQPKEKQVSQSAPADSATPVAGTNAVGGGTIAAADTDPPADSVPTTPAGQVTAPPLDPLQPPK